ncbi:type II toxin-antitoxin system PemK/MazF family toxin [Candidatus Dependentiae bacterium]|nr:type II toxin-antitoxin system PemK/MazF family toxin [Candidatus Dependentiae bacterium]
MKKGEVWWATLQKPIGTRPVVLLSRDESYRFRNACTIAQVTSRIRNIPVEVLLDQKDGLPIKSVVNLDTLETIQKSKLKRKICTLKPDKIKAINKAIKFALDLE